MVLNGCNKKVLGACKERASDTANVYIAVANETKVQHCDHSDNRFCEGEELTVMYDASLFTSARPHDQMMLINGKAYRHDEQLLLPAGTYNGVYQLEGCRKNTEDGYSCDCREEECRAEFSFTVFDVTDIQIDSIRWIDQLDCETEPEGCDFTAVYCSVGDESKQYAMEQL